jgi:hypothetical protein
VSFILDRLNADFAGAGLGAVSFVQDPATDWAGPVFAYCGSMTTVGLDDAESATATLADKFQDDVIDDRHSVWPEVDGRPLFTSADSGVACWCLDSRPWCAVGQLAGALASRADVSGR